MTTDQRYKEFKDIVDLAIAGGNAFGKSVEDGEWTWGDAFNFKDVLVTMGPAIKDFGEGIKAVKDGLNPQQYQDLIGHVKEKFDIHQDRAEVVIEESFQVVMSLWKIYNVCNGGDFAQG